MKKIIDKSLDTINISNVDDTDIICCSDRHSKNIYYKIIDNKYYSVIDKDGIKLSCYETSSEVYGTWKNDTVLLADNFEEALEWLIK